MSRFNNWMLVRSLCTSNKNRWVSSSNVRKTFLDYFEGEHGHFRIPSSSVLPDQDASLSFVNSGMYQFKDVFLGVSIPVSNRVVNSQKCIRIKGKHNDLDLVGLDGHHHTFFEMLGNWSFGDYFKKEACLWSWDLLTKVYKIPPERLYVTYFSGEETLNLPPDTETREIWAELGIPRNRILPFGMEHNFWEMGFTGPCGPCTEIHYDHEGRADASELVNKSSSHVTEVWNLVFMEFNRTANRLERLRQHFVDTGMGFERLVAVLQGRLSNYETDIFRPLFDVIQKISGHSGYNGRYDGDEMDVAYRTLADHARMVTVALSDGVIPNIENRVRMIFRNALALSKNTFKVEKGLLKELSSHVAESLAPVYPEIGKNMKKVHYIIEEEEESFWENDAATASEWAQLVKKYPQFKNADVKSKKNFLNGFTYLTNHVAKKKINFISSENAWKLYDTYGVPTKMIRKLASVLGLKFDVDEYDRYQKDVIEKQKEEHELRFKRERLFVQESKVEFEALGPDPTSDQYKYEYEVDSERGYVFKDLPVKILALLIDNKIVDSVESEVLKGGNVAVVPDKTNLFHSTRRWVCDRAKLDVGETSLDIYNVEKLGNKILHYVRWDGDSPGTVLNVNAAAVLKPKLTRCEIMRSYTGTQILKALLHAKMKVFVESSSKADHDSLSLRFLSYKELLQPKDIMELENEICKIINSGVPLERESYDLKEFHQMEDLVIRPGEIFVEPKVPVCKMTTPNFTVRFPCPGPVLPNASLLEDFIIVDFKPSGYKIKEITAVTGKKAAAARQRNKDILEKWNHIRDFHVLGFENEDAIKDRLDVITHFITEYLGAETVSYYVKVCLEEEASMKLRQLRKYILREVRYERKIKKSLKEN